MSQSVFTITLADLRILADAMCAVDVLKDAGDGGMVSAGHQAIVRTLGDQAHLVYAPDDDEPEKVPA